MTKFNVKYEVPYAELVYGDYVTKDFYGDPVLWQGTHFVDKTAKFEDMKEAMDFAKRKPSYVIAVEKKPIGNDWENWRIVRNFVPSGDIYESADFLNRKFKDKLEAYDVSLKKYLDTLYAQ